MRNLVRTFCGASAEDGRAGQRAGELTVEDAADAVPVADAFRSSWRTHAWRLGGESTL